MSDATGETIPTDDAVVAARVRDEQGGATLIAGGTAASRGAFIDATLTALVAPAALEITGGRAPLIIRVGARTGSDARSLGEAIGVAAERALTTVGAPGGLYDDPRGGPLSPLGGWLFRARAAGRHGVVIVLEEVDGWVDARGAASRAVGPAPEPGGLEVLAAALDERERRPLSVLASTRSADAGGVPALPAELVERFAHVEKLPGATSVTRDPSALVAALAGRTFSLGALKSALAGWLDVPGDADDVTVVFTSPLGPIALGASALGAAPATERAVDPIAIVAERPEGSAPDAWHGSVRAAVIVREAVRVLRGAGARRGFRQLERAYRDAASRLPLALEALARGERALGLEGTRLRAQGAAALATFEADFAECYASAYGAWLAGSARPTMLCDLHDMLAREAGSRGARGTALVVVTGLRLDAWRRLRATVLPRVPGLALFAEGVTWAARPTTPSTQRELLARGLRALAAELPPRDEPASRRSFEEALKPRREHLGHVEILRIDAYAAALSRAEGSLEDALGGVEDAMPAALLGLCGALAQRTVMAIAGDVGMRETSAGHDRAVVGSEKAAGRFTYGGDSPFEAVVPYGLLTWG